MPALALFAAALPAQAQTWKTFSSDKGFSIQYPGDWVTRGSLDRQRLDIYSEPGGLNGAVIKGGQAAIVVFREPTITSIDFDIAQSIREDPVLRRQRMAMDIGDCREVKEVLSRVDFVDPKEAPKGYVPQQHDTFFCGTTGTVIFLNVFYWADDKQQARWRMIARKMVSTIRVQS